MKKQTAAGIVLICCSFFPWPCYAQDVKTEDRMALAVAEGSSGPGKQDQRQTPLRVKTRTKVDFSGVVAHIDYDAATLSLRNSGKTITFDMSQPILQGYQSTREIRQGDTVSVGYTESGLQIRKGAHAATHGASQAPLPSVKSRPAKNTGSPVIEPKTRRNGPVRMKEAGKNPGTFQEVDNNKDGKVTAIELSVMVRDLTTRSFKEYDKNSDGVLDESEFRSVQSKH